MSLDSLVKEKQELQRWSGETQPKGFYLERKHVKENAALYTIEKTFPI